MLLTGHRTRCVFDRYNIVNEHELLTAGHHLVSYVDRILAAPADAFRLPLKFDRAQMFVQPV